MQFASYDGIVWSVCSFITGIDGSSELWQWGPIKIKANQIDAPDVHQIRAATIPDLDKAKNGQTLAWVHIGVCTSRG